MAYRPENLTLRQAVELVRELAGMTTAEAEADIAAAGRDGALTARAEAAVEHDGFLSWPLPIIGGLAYVPARFWGFAVDWPAGGLARDREWATGVTIGRADILKVWGPAAKDDAKVAPTKRGPRPALAQSIERRMLDDLQSGRVSRDDFVGWTEEALKAQYGASRDTCRKARHAALSKFVGVSVPANSGQ